MNILFFLYNKNGLGHSLFRQGTIRRERNEGILSSLVSISLLVEIWDSIEGNYMYICEKKRENGE